MQYHSIIEALHRANQSAFAAYMAARIPGEITPRQFAILAAVASEEGLSQTDLVTRTGIDRSTLADIVRRMSDRGYLRRSRTKGDARVYSVAITAKGRDLLEKASPAIELVDARIMDAFPAKEQKALMGALERIAGMSVVDFHKVRAA
jgi:MarR family transcriptional regulator, temperature-dependent positive regulator of motility